MNQKPIFLSFRDTWKLYIASLKLGSQLDSTDDIP
jgi:hypothetical protein